jgi:hypothetical protein
MKNVSNTTFVTLAAAMTIAVIAAVSLFFIFYYPQVQVKRAVNEMARAFEGEDVNKVVGYFSKDYKDPSGIVRADIEDFLVFYFESRENITVDIKKVSVASSKGAKAASIWGTVTYETRDGMQTEDFSGSPLTLRFKREDGQWRVVEVSGAEPLVE